MIRKVLLITFVFGLSFNAHSQSSIGSAYNMFGLGSLSDPGLQAFKSKGNAAIGVRDGLNVNLKNPAALNAIQGPTHIFDLDTYVSNFNQKTKSESENATVGGFGGINLWFRISNNSGIAVGISEFSRAQYDITDAYKSSNFANAYSTRYQGNGGLTQFYLAYGRKIVKNLDMGIRGSFLTGQITSEQTIFNNVVFDDVVVENADYVGKLIADLGLQYSVINKESQKLIIGLIYRPQFLIKSEFSNKIIYNQTDSLTTVGNNEYYLPKSYGVGISYSFDSWSLSADAEKQNWGINMSGEDFAYQNLDKYSIGMEFLGKDKPENYFDQVPVRFGVSWYKDYLIVKDSELRNIKLSLGVGLPFQKHRGVINLGYEYFWRKPEDSNLIYETTHSFRISISQRDKWFQKVFY